jgi:catechol 2,3-dioxygenase-like lactoylglutathione lyase family enzyme
MRKQPRPSPGPAACYHRAVRVHHLALRVEDLEACARFYTDTLGLELIARFDQSIWLRAGEVVLMLERRLRGRGPDEGSGHVLALEVQELLAWEARLALAGVPVDDRTNATLFLRDPEGHRVALSVYRFPE